MLFGRSGTAFPGPGGSARSASSSRGLSGRGISAALAGIHGLIRCDLVPSDPGMTALTGWRRTRGPDGGSRGNALREGSGRALPNPCRFSGIPHAVGLREVSLWALDWHPDILDAGGAIKPPHRSERKTMKSKKRQNAKKQAQVKPERSAKAETPAKCTIKQAVIEAITANNAVTNDELIAAVKAQFPKSAFKDSHAAWYRSQARKGSLHGHAH